MTEYIINIVFLTAFYMLSINIERLCIFRIQFFVIIFLKNIYSEEIKVYEKIINDFKSHICFFFCLFLNKLITLKKNNYS